MLSRLAAENASPGNSKPWRCQTERTVAEGCSHRCVIRALSQYRSGCWRSGGEYRSIPNFLADDLKPRISTVHSAVMDGYLLQAVREEGNRSAGQAMA